MNYYLIAGELSGDIHGANLIHDLKKVDPQAKFRGVGGDNMNSEQMDLLFNYQSITLMGFWQVLIKGSRLLRAISQCKSDILAFKPDVIILIDFGGFNLRIAKFAKFNGIRVVYFIPPKVWAWGSWRVSQLRRSVDEIIVLFPFEKKYFNNIGLEEVHYFGNPMHETLNRSVEVARSSDEGLIALLPGSRVQEVKSSLELMFGAAEKLPDHNFVVCAVDAIGKENYTTMKRPDNVSIEFNSTYEVLSKARAAVVVSGTASLECCLLKVPQVVVYRTDRLNFLIARLLIKVKFISLVNLVAEKRIVKELIQGNFTVQNLSDELSQLLRNQEIRQSMQNGYEEVSNELEGKKVYEKAAKLIAIGN